MTGVQTCALPIYKLFALKGPANDLGVLRTALTRAESGLFDAVNVRHLLDGTHAQVLEAVEIFFNEAGPEDHLFFYYSGHGYPDTNNNLYLCARDTRTDRLGSSAIPDKTINLMAENSRARKFIFVLDCCHSGGFKGGTAGVQLAHGSGRCLITACASDQLSADAATASGASTFTHFLAQALTNGEVDADGDGVVLTSEVFKYVQPRVYAATKQTVQWSMDKTFGEAAIARAPVRGARPGPSDPGPPAPERDRPVLEVSETRIEFRDVQPGEKLPLERIDVYNSGDGALDWHVESEEPWIKAERKGDSLFVTLDTAQAGLRRGNLFVRDRGRGGSKTIRVLLQVAERKDAPAPLPPPRVPPQPPQPPFLPHPPDSEFVQALQGWWMNNAGAIRIRLEGGVLVLHDFNLVGLQVGQGTVQVQHGAAHVQGMNSAVGPYNGQFAIQGNMLNASLLVGGQMVNVMFMRQQPWFAGFVS